MRIFCPECLEPMPEGSRLPYVCKCTQAVFTTKQDWLVPKKKQRARDLRVGKDIRSRNAKQKIAEKHRRLWRALHLHTGCDRNWYATWRSQFLKTKCKCSAHFLELEKLHPISFESEQEFFESTVAMHNCVNGRLEKPVCSMERAYMLWRHKRPDTGRKRCIVSVAVGDDMLAIAKLTWPTMQAYAEKTGADFIGLDNQTEDWWGLEKFRTGHFAKQYEETLFLDADCVVESTAPSVFNECRESICMLDEFSNYKNSDWLTKERKVVSERSGVSIKDGRTSLNSGVVLLRKCSSSVWNQPAVDIGQTHCAEQIWLGEQVANAIANGNSFLSLDRRWNWQWWFEDFAEGLKKAYIVHFSSAPNRLEVISKYISTQQDKAETVVLGS